MYNICSAQFHLDSVTVLIFLDEDPSNETPHGVGLIISIIMTYILLLTNILLRNMFSNILNLSYSLIAADQVSHP